MEADQQLSNTPISPTSPWLSPLMCQLLHSCIRRRLALYCSQSLQNDESALESVKAKRPR